RPDRGDPDQPGRAAAWAARPGGAAEGGQGPGPGQEGDRRSAGAPAPAPERDPAADPRRAQPAPDRVRAGGPGRGRAATGGRSAAEAAGWEERGGGRAGQGALQDLDAARDLIEPAPAERRGLALDCPAFPGRTARPEGSLLTKFLTDHGIVVALACAACGVAYGLFTSRWLLSKSPGNERMQEISKAVQEGARAYLRRQYTIIGVVAVALAIALLVALNVRVAAGFLIGGVLSASAGFIGMNVSVRANARVAESARGGVAPALDV